MWVCMPDAESVARNLTWPTVIILDEQDVCRGAPFHTSCVYGPIPDAPKELLQH